MSENTRLSDVLARYYALREQGESVTLEDLCHGSPALLEEARRELAVSPTFGTTPAEALPPTVLPTSSRPSHGLPTIPGYAILEEIGRGGMGLVLRCRDPRLDRDLAVKVLLENCRGRSDFERRFVAEAQLTGRLQHPGIVPVHELGTLEDGQPYFTMKLVRGDTLAKMLRDRPSPQHDLPRFLKLFEQIAQTLAFAHSQGVIHRDLKPSNIMVGQYGELQVMDWGLAKDLRPDSSAAVDDGGSSPTEGKLNFELQTLQGKVMGTPAYMSPEQARGETDRLDARCDVFGLGAILCEVLTGMPAYRGRDGSEVIRLAALGDLTDAHARLAQCGADTELIALAHACLAGEPDQRPADAGQVAATFSGYLAGVQEKLRAAEIERAATEAKMTEVRAKVAAERRAARLWTGLAAALVLGVGASLFFAWQSRQRAAEAESARKEAEANLRLSKKAVDDLFLSVTQTPLLKPEKMREVRKMLLERAMPFYEHFQEQRGNDPIVLSDAAWNHKRVAQIAHVLGDKEKAKAAYERARVNYAKLAAAWPEDTRYRFELAGVLTELGLLFSDTGRRAEAHRCYEEARGLQEKLVADHPGDPEYEIPLAATWNNLGLIYLDQGQPGEALKYHERAREVRAKLAAAQPANAEYQNELARSWLHLGLVYRATNRPAAAMEAFEQARLLRERVAADRPDQSEYQASLAGTLRNIGLLRDEMRQPAEALQAYEQARALSERLVADQPMVAPYRADLAGLWTNIGLLHQRSGRHSEAVAAYAEARKLYTKLAGDFPTVTRYRAELAATDNNLGIVHNLMADVAAAQEDYDAARAVLEPLVKEQPEVTRHQIALGGTYVNLGNLVGDKGPAADALAWFDKGIVTLDAVRAKEAENPVVREYLGNAHWGRADMLGKLERYRDAVPSWDRAIELDAGPNKAELRIHRAVAVAHTGDTAQALSEAESLASTPNFDGETLFDLARVWSLVASSANANAELQLKYSGRAMGALNKANELGLFRDRAKLEILKKVGDFDLLRQREDFKKLVQD